MPDPKTHYDELLTLVRKAELLGSCGAVLGWDRETYMPPGGNEHRANQLSLLAGVAHEWSTSPKIGELLDQLADSEFNDGAESDSVANIREIRRTYERSRKLPQRLVEELSRVTALAQQHWAEARQKNDFAAFAPWLSQIVKLKQEEAAAVGFAENGEPYDALLDEYEPGAESADVASVFDALRTELVPLLDAIKGAGRQPDTSLLNRHYPVDAQAVLGREAATAIGFDFNKGRLDVTTHPFCSGFGPGDCRLTTRYDPDFFSSAFFGTLHESGHGMYEQGLPGDAFGTPLGSSVSLGIHESQSRMWENLVGRGLSFWKHFFPRAQELFPDALGNTLLDQFHFAVNAVSPSFIRVEADEVTYNLHIMLRFDLERDLISGRLPPEEVPTAWNERFTNDFGITPETDANGCLQDVHWSAGLFGYFPTYALGNMYAAQFFEAAEDKIGDLQHQFAKGEFQPLLQWLRQHIHQHGRRLSASRLVEVVTGSTLSNTPLMNQLNNRFKTLYGI
ncbi:carboxypeptidase M32 [Fuerstiella marisgermanici]|uniref:Metal-dependent carboxypeptidase n=1 Tax=Fuerstiella marisgermanici TaxID=1891926 RepID=A0A1P8WKV5_9PLAN|nr:carboxypeptidase M32 [Fuerstiella marisgermanici]APZ94696.1 Thermostable carboxypeptidase 1 [Fuerstiella marisgermanici]